jgi:aminoglycoside-2''-adenylyltransferase
MDAIKKWDGPALDAWEPWTPKQVAQALAGTTAPWCIVGGWAIDLFLDRETRAHADIEIGVPEPFFPVIFRSLSQFLLHGVGGGEVSQLNTSQELRPEKHQCWVLDKDANKWRLDVMREPGDEETWCYRRDTRIVAERSRIVAVAANNIPYLRPEGVLLYKAKALRPKDESDFSSCLPLMDRTARTWLRTALTLAHPGHVWLSRLG